MSRSAWARALRTPTGFAASATVLLLLVVAVIGPPLMQDAASEFDTSALREGPSASNWLGTDALGRDVLARVVVATRLSIGLALAATVIGVLGGLVVGMLPVVLGRRAGRLIKGSVDIAVAFPGLLVALCLAVVFGVGAQGAVLAIGLTAIPTFARLTENLAAGVANADYVAAARLAGVSPRRLLFRHVLPNIGEPLIINATIGAGAALLAFAGLSFLGLGVQPPDYDWGRLLLEGLSRIYDAPIAALAPGVAIVVAGLAFSLVGETAAQVVGMRTATRTRLPHQPRDVQWAEAPASTDGSRSELVLDVERLEIAFDGPSGPVLPVAGVSLQVGTGEMVGIVGESGSGKSLTALAVAGLLPPTARSSVQHLRLFGQDIEALDGRERDTLLGTSLAMIFQDPMSSLNPALRVGRQVGEVAEVHLGETREQAERAAVERMREVRIAAADVRARQYPHEFSGGMRQRAMIAMGLVATPRLLIADEPTTALDVTVQREVLRLLRAVRDRSGTAVLLISHDIAVVAELCERVVVMYAGLVVEDGPVEEVLRRPAHPYTRALLDTVPDMETARDQALATIPGRPPAPADRPSGCPFAPRCPRAQDVCTEQLPPLLPVVGTRAACWFPHQEERVTASAGSRELT